MTPADFKDSIAGSAPPAAITGPLQALWWAAKGDWGRAHQIVMSDEGANAAWVHGYLHRVEGDLPNARYWYGAAGRLAARGSLEDEWHAIVNALLTQKAP